MTRYLLFFGSMILAAVCHDATAQNPTASLVFSKTIDGPAETSFTSSDFIYARIEVTGGTMNDYFSLSAIKTKYPHLRTKIWINFNGKDMQGHPYEYLLLKESDKSKTVYNFDILPDPAKASSIVAYNSDFTSVLTNSTFAISVSDRIFSKEGMYTTEVRVIGQKTDQWGKLSDVVLKGKFTLDFRFADIGKITKETKQAAEKIKSTAFKLDKLPAVFSKQIQSKDPKLTRAKIASILKRDLAGRNILKFAIGEHTTTWSIMKNDFGIPTYRYFNGDIYYVYKDGNVCKVDALYLREDYIGGGRYGTLKVGGGGGGNAQLIDCAVVK